MQFQSKQNNWRKPLGKLCWCCQKGKEKEKKGVIGSTARGALLPSPPPPLDGRAPKIRRSSPPTKSGKNNDCRQTNARTVYIIKYINFFDGPVHTVTLKRYRFKTRFYVKYLKQTPRRVEIICKFFWVFFAFLGPQNGCYYGQFTGEGSCNEKNSTDTFLGRGPTCSFLYFFLNFKMI